DRASVYETEGHRFESCLARPLKPASGAGFRISGVRRGRPRIVGGQPGVNRGRGPSVLPGARPDLPPADPTWAPGRPGIAGPPFGGLHAGHVRRAEEDASRPGPLRHGRPGGWLRAGRDPSPKTRSRKGRGLLILRSGDFEAHGARVASGHSDGEETQMAYGVVHTFPGGTQEQYEASIAAVHPSRDELPDGQIFHAAGPTADGWVITAVHESQESWERFRDNILGPAMAKGV